MEPVYAQADRDVSVTRTLGPEQGAHCFKAVSHGKFTCCPLIYLAEGRPAPVGPEVVRHYLLIEPCRVVQLEVDVKRRLEEGDQRAIELLDEPERADIGNFNFAIQPETRAWL